MDETAQKKLVSQYIHEKEEENKIQEYHDYTSNENESNQSGRLQKIVLRQCTKNLKQIRVQYEKEYVKIQKL